MRRLVVVEGSADAMALAVHDATRAGERITPGWHGRSPIVCFGVVRDAGDAAAALLAAIAGAGVIAHAQGSRDVIDRLVDDLRRFGPVDHRTGEPASSAELAAPVVLDQDERRLLDLLAGGSPLGHAAAELHLSRRTADRRLASARQKLGVTTTSEAIVAHVRGGRASLRTASERSPAG